MSPLRQSLALVVLLAITFAAAGIGSIATTPNIAKVYGLGQANVESAQLDHRPPL
ncbi:MAG: hypothetical protein ACLQNE_22030 [Thermoguttaceae bacterium]